MSRGEVVLYVDEDDDFVGIGIRLGDNSVVVVRPDGTLLSTGTPTKDLLARSLGEESAKFLQHFARMGECLALAFDQLPDGYRARVKTAFTVTGEPVVESPNNTSKQENK